MTDSAQSQQNSEANMTDSAQSPQNSKANQGKHDKRSLPTNKIKQRVSRLVTAVVNMLSNQPTEDGYKRTMPPSHEPNRTRLPPTTTTTSTTTAAFWLRQHLLRQRVRPEREQGRLGLDADDIGRAGRWPRSDRGGQAWEVPRGRLGARRGTPPRRQAGGRGLGQGCDAALPGEKAGVVAHARMPQV